jgi:hypothetical protein
MLPRVFYTAGIVSSARPFFSMFRMVPVDCSMALFKNRMESRLTSFKPIRHSVHVHFCPTGRRSTQESMSIFAFRQSLETRGERLSNPSGDVRHARQRRIESAVPRAAVERRF